MTSRTSARWAASLLLLSGIVPTLGACTASVNGNAKGSADANGAAGDVDFDAEAGASSSGDANAGWDTPSTKNPISPIPEQAAAPPTPAPLLGARHDLLLKAGSPASCNCLAVALGQPTSPNMIWTGRRPATNANTQLVIALGSEGIGCSESGPGASYMGYEMKDGNVVVNVEAAVEGRPITHGAVIPRPQSGGQVLIRPMGKIPYGKGKNGETQCALGMGQ